MENSDVMWKNGESETDMFALTEVGGWSPGDGGSSIRRRQSHHSAVEILSEVKSIETCREVPNLSRSRPGGEFHMEK
jgi:hypothetical protein